MMRDELTLLLDDIEASRLAQDELAAGHKRALHQALKDRCELILMISVLLAGCSMLGCGIVWAVVQMRLMGFGVL